MPGEMQYIADTLLIERIIRIDAMLSDDPIIKEAQFLEGLSGEIATAAKSMLDFSSTGSTIKTVINLLSPAMLFRLNPLVGGLYLLGSMFGYDLGSVVSSILSKISPKLSAGEPVTAQEVNEAGKSALSSLPQTTEEEPIGTEASLHELYELEKRGEISRTALFGIGRGGWGGYPTGGYGMFPPRGTGILGRLFFRAPPRSRGGLLVGLIVWIIKTVLVSAGLLAGASAIKRIVSPGEKTEVGAGRPEAPPVPTSPVGLKSSGVGQEYHQNDGTVMWEEPLRGRGIPEMLIDWATEIYSDFVGHEDVITNSPEFKEAVDLLTASHRQGATSIIIPEGFTTRMQVVNLFAADVAKQIKGTQNV